MKCNPFRILVITDGTTRINLLEKKSGFCCTDWTPAITEPKGGGVWRDSPLAHGRRLAMQRRANAIETYALQVRNWNPDDLIRDTQDLRRLLEKAVAYDTTEWQDEPVWIEALGLRETNKRYSLIRDYRAAVDGYPYGSAFWNALGRAAVSDWPLMLEREPFWRSVPPGQPCPDERYETGCFPSFLEFNGDTSDVDCGNPAKLNDLPDFAVAGKGQITVDGWIRADGWGEGNLGTIANKLYWSFYIDNTSGLRGMIGCAAIAAQSSSGTDEFTADGLDHHVLMCYDETGAGTPAARTIYLAIDGVWVATYGIQLPSVGNYTSDAAQNLHIGNTAVGNRCFDGGIGLGLRVSDYIRYDPAGGDFIPPPRCDLPATDANTIGLWIFEGDGAVAHDLGISPAADGDISNCEWDCDCEYSDPVDCNCVQASGEQKDWNYTIWQFSTNAPAANAQSLIETAANYLVVGENARVLWTIDAVVWNVAAAPPAGVVHGFVESGNYLYCITTTGVYRSPDNGNNWAPRSNAIVSNGNANNGITATSDGALYACGTFGGNAGVHRSMDGGTTWTTLVADNDANGAIYATSQDVVYAGNIAIFLCTDGAIFFPVFSDVDFDRVRGFVETLTGNVVAVGYESAGGFGRIYRTGNGIQWTRQDVSPIDFLDVIRLESGMLVASGGSAFIAWGDIDGSIWKDDNTGIATASIYSIAEFSVTGKIYGGVTVAAVDEIWESPDLVIVGRLAACVDETFFANKRNIAQITQVKVYDDSIIPPPPKHTDQFPAAGFPYPLLPAPFAVGDAIYFGIATNLFDNGPFCSLVFDISQPLAATGANTIRWEYSDATPCNWVPLNVQDGTALIYPFDNIGVNSVHWVPPDDWTPCIVDGVNAYWVRVHVQALGGAWVQSPVQQRRDVYTVNWPRTDVDEVQVRGDVPALLRVKAHNRSDEDAYETVDELDLLDNRLIVGLRSRINQFTAFINLAEDGIIGNVFAQNPAGIAVTDGTGTTTTREIRAPCGACCVHTTQGNGLNNYDDAAIVTLGPSIARDYYGEFHVFLRSHLYEPLTSPVGDHDDVRVRLKVQSGTGGVIEYTDFQQFVGFDAWDGVAGIEETYKDWQLLDFGRVTLPVTTLMKSDELPDQFAITVQVASVATTKLLVDLYDLVLIPVDEWPGDFVDTALEDDSGVSNGYLLDVDSVSFPKQERRALVRTADASAFVKAVYQPVTPGPALLQANADQRLWFLSARGVYLGYQTGGGPGAAFLTDSYADFLDAGVKPGMTIWNLTDGSSGPITAVTQTTVTATLAGGAGNDWDDADQYLIVCPCWRSEPWVVHSVQLWHVARYFSFRGDR